MKTEEQENNVCILAPEGYEIIGYGFPTIGIPYLTEDELSGNQIVKIGTGNEAYRYPLLKKIEPKIEAKLFKIELYQGMFVVRLNNGVRLEARPNTTVGDYTLVGFTELTPDKFDIEEDFIEPNLFLHGVPYEYAVGRKF